VTKLERFWPFALRSSQSKLLRFPPKIHACWNCIVLETIVNSEHKSTLPNLPSLSNQAATSVLKNSRQTCREISHFSQTSHWACFVGGRGALDTYCILYTTMSFSHSGAVEVTAGTVPPVALSWILETVLQRRHNVSRGCVEKFGIGRLSGKPTIT
jgi:hypothetical protein